MIRQHQQAVRSSCIIQLAGQWSQHPPVNVFDCLDLPLRASLMPHLIRRFNMKIRKIIPVFQQRVHRRLSLALIIGIQASICSRNLRAVHPRADGNSFEQIHRRDHDASLSEGFPEIRKRRPCTRAPEPETVGWILSLPLPFKIQRMLLQDLITAFLHLQQPRIRGKPRSDLLLQNIVGRSQFPGHAVFPYHAVPVAGSHIKLSIWNLHPVQNCLEQNLRIFGTDLVGTVIQDRLFLIGRILLRQCNEITSESNVSLFHSGSDAQRFQRGTSGIILLRIITKD